MSEQFCWLFWWYISILLYPHVDYGPIEIPDMVQSVATYAADGPRLMITQIVNENFKSYAGVQKLGPFNKVTCQ